MGNKTTVEITEQTLYNIDILEDETTVVTVEVPQDIVTVEISQFTVDVELYNSDNDVEGQPVFAKSGSDFTLRSFTDDDKTVEVLHAGPTNELIKIKLPDSGIRVQDGFVISTDSDDTANITFNGSNIDINGVDDLDVNALTANTAAISGATSTGDLTVNGDATFNEDITQATGKSATFPTLTSTDATITTATITTGDITTVNATDVNVSDDLTVTDDASIGGNLSVTENTTVSGNVTVTANVLANNAVITNNITGVDIDTDTGSIDVLNVVTAEASDEFIGDIRGAVRFRAKAGTQLSKGDVVYVSGISGNIPVVEKADASDPAKMPAYGLVFADVNENASLEVVTFGQLHGLNTSSFSLGTVWVSATTPGDLTQTKPTNPDHLVQNIGRVKRVHTSAGAIIVGGAGRTNDVPNEISILGDIDTTANMTANNITITNDITTDDLTGVQATITTVNATDVNATTVTATTGDITTVNATDVNSTDATLTGTVTAPTGTITTVNATDVNTTDLSVSDTATIATGDITTVNATTVNSTDVNATDLTLTGDISAVVDITTSGDVVIGGDLTVSGTTTTINTETLELADNNIVLNSNHTGTPTQDAGITVERGSSDDAVFQWNETTDKFEVKVGTADAVFKAEDLESSTLTATQATITTGAITTVNSTTVNATDVNTTNVDATQIDSVDIDVTNNITTLSANVTNTANIGTLVTSTASIPNLTSTNIDVNGGEIDGTPIGANSHTTGKFTTLAGQQLWISSDATLQTNSTVRITPNNIFVDQIQSQGTNKDYVIIDDDLYPENGGNLGTNTTGSWTNGRWTNVYSQNGDFNGTLSVNNIDSTNSSTNAIESFAHIIPDPSTVTDSVSNLTLGNGSNRWDRVWADEIDINEIVGNTNISGSLIPTANESYDLGSPTNAWREVYIGPGSLYIDGHKVLGSDATGQIDITTDDDQNLNIFAGADGTSGDITMGSAGSTTTLQDATVNLGPSTNDGTVNIRGTLETPDVHVGDLELSSTLFEQTQANQNLEIRTSGTGYLHANVADVYVGTLTNATKIDENSIEVIGGDTLTLRDDVDVTGLVKVNDGFVLSSFNPFAGSGLPATAMDTTLMGVGQQEGYAGITVRSRGEHDWGLSAYGINPEAPKALLALQAGRLDGSSDDYLNDADIFGSIQFNPYSGYKTGAEWLTASALIESYATENHSSSGMGTKIRINTTENGNSAGATDSTHTNKHIDIQGTTITTSDTLKIDDDLQVTGNIGNNGSAVDFDDIIKVTGNATTKTTTIGDFESSSAQAYANMGMQIDAGDTAWPTITFKEYAGADGGNKPVNLFTNPGFETEVFGGTPSSPAALGDDKRIVVVNGTAANASTLPQFANIRFLGLTVGEQSATNRGSKWQFQTTPENATGTQTTVTMKEGNVLQLGNGSYDSGHGFIQASGGDLKLGSVLDTNNNDIVNSGGDVRVNDSMVVTGNLDVDGLTELNGDVNLGDAQTDTITVKGKLNTTQGFQFTTLDVSTANYLSGVLGIVSAGDAAYISDGDAGSPCLGVYDGSNWKVIAFGNNISSS